MNDYYRCGCSMEENTWFPCADHRELTFEAWTHLPGAPMTETEASQFWRQNRVDHVPEPEHIPEVPFGEMDVVGGDEPEQRIT